MVQKSANSIALKLIGKGVEDLSRPPGIQEAYVRAKLRECDHVSVRNQQANGYATKGANSNLVGGAVKS
jgi:hypothetical protein